MSSKKALVTGGAARIGESISCHLAGAGIEVIVHYNRSEEKASRVVEKLRENGGRAWKVQADFKEKSQVESLIERAKNLSGGIDYLVNNASIFPPGKIENLEYSELEESILVNTWAPFELSRSFTEEFSSGKIVNILDTRVKGYDWDHAAYILSKKVLAQLTKMMALNISPDFSVNGVAPGVILPPKGEGESYFDKLIDRIPLNKRGYPSDVARTVLFLLRSDFITGEILSVDGGRHLLREKDSF